MPRNVSSIFSLWLLFAVTITLLCGIIYILLQQNYRQNANDPQIQMAEDAARSLSLGNSSQSALSQHVDIAESLSPYTIVYNEQGKIIASSATLHGKIPTIPSGVFADVKKNNQEDHFTWQLEPGVRQAVVVLHYGGIHPGYVLVGRSLREVEKRVDMLTLQVGLGWIGSLVVMMVTIFAAFSRGLMGKRV